MGDAVKKPTKIMSKTIACFLAIPVACLALLAVGFCPVAAQTLQTEKSEWAFVPVVLSPNSDFRAACPAQREGRCSGIDQEGDEFTNYASWKGVNRRTNHPCQTK